MTPEQAFGLLLKRYRVNSMISQEELAHLCGLDRTFISLLERGKRQPSLRTILSLANELDVKPSTLLDELECLLDNSLHHTSQKSRNIEKK